MDPCLSNNDSFEELKEDRCTYLWFRLFSGSKEERQVYEKAQHRNKLQQRGEKPGLQLKVFVTVHTFTEGIPNTVKTHYRNGLMQKVTAEVVQFKLSPTYMAGEILRSSWWFSHSEVSHCTLVVLTPANTPNVGISTALFSCSGGLRSCSPLIFLMEISPL